MASNTRPPSGSAARTINAVDLRTLDRHRDAAITSLIPALLCRSCPPNAPLLPSSCGCPGRASPTKCEKNTVEEWLATDHRCPSAVTCYASRRILSWRRSPGASRGGHASAGVGLLQSAHNQPQFLGPSTPWKRQRALPNSTQVPPARVLAPQSGRKLKVRDTVSMVRRRWSAISIRQPLALNRPQHAAPPRARGELYRVPRRPDSHVHSSSINKRT